MPTLSYSTVVTLERNPNRHIVQHGQRGATYGQAVYTQDVYTDRGKLDVNVRLDRSNARSLRSR